MGLGCAAEQGTQSRDESYLGCQVTKHSEGLEWEGGKASGSQTDRDADTETGFSDEGWALGSV